MKKYVSPYQIHYLIIIFISLVCSKKKSRVDVVVLITVLFIKKKIKKKFIYIMKNDDVVMR